MSHPSPSWRDGHPMGKRPRPWFGPEDDDGVTDPTLASQERYAEQRLWDLLYHSMSIWARWACHFKGQVIEPVDTYGRPDDHLDKASRRAAARATSTPSR